MLGQRDIVKDDPPQWDIYYHMTPSFSLAAVQDRSPLDNVLTNNLTSPADYVNTQVWELTFSDPTKILGAKRNIQVNTSLANNVIEPNNPNTANMQHKNVLFYKGEFLDYNANLIDGGGEYFMESVGTKELHFWRVATPQGNVFVGATEYPAAGGGILEVREEESGLDFASFMNEIRETPSSLLSTGNQTTYTSTLGDQIVYSNSTGDHGDGNATVNGATFALSDYAQYDSPYLNSPWGGGTINATFEDNSLWLDFRNRNNPIRNEVTVSNFNADFDDDDAVAGSDFLTWQRGYDRKYYSDDLADWQAEYGTGVPPSQLAAVPEPASLWLCAVGTAWACRRFRRENVGSSCQSHDGSRVL